MPQDESDSRMAFLPLCHVAERQFGAYFSLYTGIVLNFVESIRTRFREPARGIADRYSRRAAYLGEVLFRHGHDRRIGGHAAATAALSSWAIGQGEQVVERVLGGQPVPSLAQAALSPGALAGAQITCAS